MIQPTRLLPYILLAAGLCVGCNKDEVAIHTYNAPKDTAAPASATETENSHTAPILWTLPQGWKQVPNTQQMRFATFAVSADDPKAQLTVMALPETAAAVLPNVTRWAGQLKLPEPTTADLSKYCQQTQVSGEQATIIDMTGSPESGDPPTRLLAAIIPHDGQAWFLTLKAAAPIAAAQKPQFDQFLHSIQFPTASASATPSTPAPAAEAQSSYHLTHWKTPQGWVEQPGSNAMRITSFRVGSGAQSAEVIVSRIAEQGIGSLSDNLNRWRGQVGLGPVENDRDGISPTSVAKQPAMMINFVGPQTGDQPPREILVALTLVGSDGWFFKMLGPQSVVSKEHDAFKQFLDSLQFQPESN